jgi:hypothetical protein
MLRRALLYTLTDVSEVLKRRSLSIGLHGATTQTAVNIKLIAMRT